MELSERIEFMAKYDPNTMLGDHVRKLLVVMVLTEINGDANSRDISQACEDLLRKVEHKEIPIFIAEAEIIFEYYKEISDNGISIGSQ